MTMEQLMQQVAQLKTDMEAMMGMIQSNDTNVNGTIEGQIDAVKEEILANH